MPRFNWYPTVINLAAEKESAVCIRETDDSLDVRQLKTELSHLRDERFLNRLAPLARTSLKRDVSGALGELEISIQTLKERVKILLWLVMGLTLTVLPLIQMFVIGERAYIARNLGQFIACGVVHIAILRTKRKTSALLHKINRDWTSTLVIATIMFIPVAFIPSCRGLYDKWQFTTCNIVFTAIFVYWFQFSSIDKRRRERRTIKKQSLSRPFNDTEVQQKLDRIEPLVNKYEDIQDKYVTSYLETSRDGITREFLSGIVNTLVDCLSLAARAGRPQVSKKTKRAVSIPCSSTATGVQVVVVFSLWGQWGSFAQSFVFSLSYCGNLWKKTLVDLSTIKEYFDFFSIRFFGGFFAFLLVSIPLLKDKEALDNSLALFIGTAIGIAFFTLVLTDYLMQGVVRLLEKMSPEEQRSEEHELEEAASSAENGPASRDEGGAYTTSVEALVLNSSRTLLQWENMVLERPNPARILGLYDEPESGPTNTEGYPPREQN